MLITKKTIALVAATAALGIGYANTVQAQTNDSVTFAQFQQSVSGNPFVFTNNGSTSGGSTFVTGSTAGTMTGIPIAINFQYETANGYGTVNSNIAATLTVQSWVDGTDETVTLGGKKYIDQPLKNVMFTITADSPINGKSNLLTVTSLGGADLLQGTGSLDGKGGGNTATLSADTATGDNVLFTSDFLSFGNPAAYNYSLGLSSLNPAYSTNGDGYLNSFTSAGAATFASTPGPTPVPAPSTLTVFSAGAWCVALAMIVGTCRTRRRTCNA